jgi:hypothetical protein
MWLWIKLWLSPPTPTPTPVVDLAVAAAKKKAGLRIDDDDDDDVLTATRATREHASENMVNKAMLCYAMLLDIRDVVFVFVSSRLVLLFEK